MFLREYGLPELNEELCVAAIKNKEAYVNNLKNGVTDDPQINKKDEEQEDLDTIANQRNSQFTTLAQDNATIQTRRSGHATTVPSPMDA